LVGSVIGAPFWRHLPPAGRANSGTYFRLRSGQNFGEGDRPDRVEPRQVKRRPKNYAKLKVPRAEARRRLMKDATRKGPKT
jgi:hypothetical protein